jgi:hypothetical protein
MKQFASSTLMCVITSVVLLTASPTQAADYVSVSYRNDSNIPVVLGVRMINGQYRWDNLAPGETGRTNVQIQLLTPAIDGAQKLGIALKTRDGSVRTGTLPIHISFPFNDGRPIAYVTGRVIRRSPGVPGIVDGR